VIFYFFFKKEYIMSYRYRNTGIIESQRHASTSSSSLRKGLDPIPRPIIEKACGSPPVFSVPINQEEGDDYDEDYYKNIPSAIKISPFDDINELDPRDYRNVHELKLEISQRSPLLLNEILVCDTQTGKPHRPQDPLPKRISIGFSKSEDPVSLARSIINHIECGDCHGIRKCSDRMGDSHHGSLWVKLTNTFMDSHDPTIKQIIDNFIRSGVDFDCDESIAQLMAQFAEHNKFSEVCKMMEVGVNPNVESSHGWTPLHSAASNGHESIGNVLMLGKANVNAQTVTGITPLIIACKSGNPDMVRTLINGRADVNHRQDDGQQAVHIAAELGFHSILDELYISQADMSSKGLKGRTPLHNAAANGRTETVRFLCQRDALVNSCDNNLMTPLHLACVGGFDHTIRKLIEYHAQVNRSDLYDQTPISIAKGRKHRDILKLLQEAKRKQMYSVCGVLDFFTFMQNMMWMNE